ncbi:hypothetical protein RAS1_24210 [Phycisphaerae bacterium RAS1]|nr:hypothetical protein RAS1_24210 [Phycisphaerae bacterium RAS1]
MIANTRRGIYTFGDFLELTSEDEKSDLLNGVILMASPESTEHNKLVWWFGTILGQFVEARGLGTVFLNKVAFRLTDLHGPEPDVALVRAERSGIIKSGYVDGPPDLAVEIVSPDSVTRDYQDKRAAYEGAGVPEYWIIDPDESRATLLVMTPTGFEPLATTDAVLRSRILPGFELAARHLWQRPLPATLEIVRGLLS